MLYKKSGLLGISGISNDMRDLLGSNEPRRAPGGGLFRLSGGQGDRRARRRSRRARRARVHRRHRRELGRDPQADLRGVGMARHRARCAGESAARDTRHLAARQQRLGLGDPDERGTDDRPAHRGAAGTGGLHPWSDAAARSAEEQRWLRLQRRRRRPPTRFRPGRGSRDGLWQRRSTSATSSSRTTRPTTVTPAFLAAGDARAPRASGTSSTTCFVEERKKGVLDVSQIPSSITAHAPGYIDRDNEIIVGLQTEAPLKRAIMPNGGFRMVAERAQDLRLRARSAGRRGVHQVPQDAQRRGLRRLHRRRPALPQFAHPYRAARRLRPRPDHRRLPPRRALRRRRG